MMKVEINKNQDEIVFDFKIEKEDQYNPSEKYSFGKSRVVVKIPGIEKVEIHPDLLALSIILMCHPFVGNKLTIPFTVSEKFLKNVRKVLSRYKIETSSKKDLVKEREIIQNGRPSLAFSGGIDSTAALAIMPRNTVPVFMNRPLKNKSLYKSDAAINSCEFLDQIGYEVKNISCDLEYLRDPVGFPTDLSHAVPAILMADILRLDSIAFGTVLESAFGTGHDKFRDYGKGSHWKFYGTLFNAVGMPICLPVSGISEVGTAIICEIDPLGYLGQSCIRGTWKEPCKMCWKGCRKGLLNLARGVSDDPINLDKILKSNEVKIKLKSVPISHENIMEYSVKRIEDNYHLFIPLLRKRVVRSVDDLSFLEKWYKPSLSFVPDKYKRIIKENILKYMEPMSEDEESKINNWDMVEFIKSTRENKILDEIEDFFIIT